MEISTLVLTLYVLIWPVVVAGALWVIMRAFFRDLRTARREGRGII